MYTCLLYEETNRIARISLNRPEKRNALNDVLVAELRDAFERAAASVQVRAIILSGVGPAFCAGADLEYLQRMQNFTLDQNLADSASLAELMLAIYRHPKVVIAQVEGPAIAGGCGLVTVCDFAFATPEAKFGYSEVKIGFVPAIVMAFLIRKVGETRAKELLLSGFAIPADLARQYQLITATPETDDLKAYVEAFAQKMIHQNSGMSMSLTKKMIADVQDLPLEAAIKFAARMNAHARTSADCKQGIEAFLNKDPLEW